MMMDRRSGIRSAIEDIDHVQVSFCMKIAMLVHNGVWKDARVLKEARTLAAAGYQIEIHGIDHSLQPLREPFPVFLSSRMAGIAPSVKPGPLAARWGRRLQEHLDVLGRKLPIRWFALKLRRIATRTLPPGNVFLIFLACFIFSTGSIALYQALHSSNLLLFGLCMAIAMTFGIVVVRAVWLGNANLRQLSTNPQKSLNKLKSHLRRTNLINIDTLMSRISSLMFLSAQKALKHSGKHTAPILYRQAYLSVSNALIASVEKRGRPDIIHIHDHVALTGAKALKERYKCPIVWDAHEIYEDLAASNPARGALNAEIIRENQPFIDHFVTINDSIAGFYERNYKKLGRATVVMNATEVMPVPVDDGRLHKAANLPAEQRILLFQGGFAEKRGLEQLITAASMLDTRWTLVLMGWGNLEGRLRTLAAETARSDRTHPAVVFLPGVPQRELQQWSAGAALGAIPYENTGLNHLYCTPNKLWEYPNAGVPVLATALEEMNRIIGMAGTGFLLPREFTAKDIADTVNNITDEQLTLARQACLNFIQIDNWSVYETRLLALYDRIVKKNSSRTSPVKLQIK